MWVNGSYFKYSDRRSGSGVKNNTEKMEKEREKSLFKTRCLQ